MYQQRGQRVSNRAVQCAKWQIFLIQI